LRRSPRLRGGARASLRPRCGSRSRGPARGPRSRRAARGPCARAAAAVRAPPAVRSDAVRAADAECGGGGPVSDSPRRLSEERGAALERKLGSSLTLPSLPSIVSRLAELCHNPDTGIRDVAALVAYDPPLCARTLRIVNSAYI